MKVNKLDRFETKSASEPSPEQINQAKQTFVNLLTPVIEKMLKSPGDIKPVSDSFESLARQAKFGIVRQTTIIDSGEKSAVQPTKNIMGDAENSAGQPTKFSNEELELLRQIQENA
jgi:hypothetical protein